MVAVVPRQGIDYVVRRAWRIAARMGADLYVVHITDREGPPLPGQDDLVALRLLAVDLGAIWTEVADYDTAGALLRFALQRRITHIVLATSGRRRRGAAGVGGPVLRRVLRLAAPAGIDVHVMATVDGSGAYQTAAE